MIGVVVPAHNEELYLECCLAALKKASQNPLLNGEVVHITLVLDDCTDGSALVADKYECDVLEISSRNVGRARSVGAIHAMAVGARWLAFTDADTIVSPSWLVDQLMLDADLVCGSVGVYDWSDHGKHSVFLKSQFYSQYNDTNDHRHIHGANLGVSTEAYVGVGGFKHLTCGEDVALVEDLLASGAKVAWSAVPRVFTSARTNPKAKGGFGDNLLKILKENLPDLISGANSHAV